MPLNGILPSIATEKNSAVLQVTIKPQRSQWTRVTIATLVAIGALGAAFALFDYFQKQQEMEKLAHEVRQRKQQDEDESYSYYLKRVEEISNDIAYLNKLGCAVTQTPTGYTTLCLFKEEEYNRNSLGKQASTTKTTFQKSDFDHLDTCVDEEFAHLPEICSHLMDKKPDLAWAQAVLNKPECSELKKTFNKAALQTHADKQSDACRQKIFPLFHCIVAAHEELKRACSETAQQLAASPLSHMLDDRLYDLDILKKSSFLDHSLPILLRLKGSVDIDRTGDGGFLFSIGSGAYHKEQDREKDIERLWSEYYKNLGLPSHEKAENNEALQPIAAI